MGEVVRSREIEMEKVSTEGDRQACVAVAPLVAVEAHRLEVKAGTGCGSHAREGGSDVVGGVRHGDDAVCKEAQNRAGDVQVEIEGQEGGCGDSQEVTMATAAEILALVESQDFRCALSGVRLSPDVAQIDHIVPVSRGGGGEISNLQVLHKEVNRMKGTMGNLEFAEWCAKVASASPPVASGPLANVPTACGRERPEK